MCIRDSVRTIDDEIREITLNVEQFYAQQAIDPEMRFAMPPRVRADYDIHVGMVLVRMIQDVLIQRECVAEYPADWWQALKERFAPKWFLRRYPVLKSRIDMEV